MNNISQKNKEIIVLASGSGSNFQSLIEASQSGYFPAKIRALVVDRPCHATNKAIENNINYFELSRKNDSIFNNKILAKICKNADLIICAGYLSILHNDFINIFNKKIINIHPSLLPKFGGAGMYGKNVHKAVIKAKETKSGCTVHYVDSGIDTGEIIDQLSVSVNKNDNADILQNKILKLEHQLLSKVVKKLLEKDK